MSAYPLGTVAWADIDGVGSYKVMHIGTENGTAWAHTNDETGQVLTSQDRLSNIRPLVVLDLEVIGKHLPTRGDWSEAVHSLRHKKDPAAFFTTNLRIAEQIEAQTKPPRIPEPSLYGVVSSEDDAGLTTYFWHSHGGWHGENGSLVEWNDIHSPKLIRDGIEATS